MAAVSYLPSNCEVPTSAVRLQALTSPSDSLPQPRSAAQQTYTRTLPTTVTPTHPGAGTGYTTKDEIAFDTTHLNTQAFALPIQAYHTGTPPTFTKAIPEEISLVT